MKARTQENDYFRLKTEIEAGKKRNVYVFTGSEDFLMEEMAEELFTGRLPGEADRVNLNYVYGDLPLSQVMDMAETVSLFGDSRVVVVRDALYFAKGRQQEEEQVARLLKFNAADCEPSCLVFYAKEFAKTAKAQKELAAKGAVFQFESLKPPDLYDWLSKKLAVRGKSASRDVLALFVQRVGRDMRRLSTELDKVITFLGSQRELDEASVTIATARSLQGDIFSLTDAVVRGRTAKALGLLKDLIGAGEPPLRILAMLVRQFRMLSESYELMQRGCAMDELAARLGILPFVAEKLAAQAVKTDGSKLLRAVDLLLQADLDIKRGRIEQTLALETLIVALGEKTA